MVENSNSFGNLDKKPRSKKIKNKIDLSAMVSVSFLLIVFFMVTIELAKPRIMSLGLPDNSVICGTTFTHCGMDNRRVITLLLDDNDKIISYKGTLNYPEQTPETLNYNTKSIRTELLDLKKEVIEVTGNKNRAAIVIIKPSKKSTYGNLVAILDEMNITNIETYAIINDFTAEERNLLALN